MDTRKNIVILKTTDDWRKWIEQLSTEAMKENVWEYINPDPNRMVLEPAPAKPTEPVAPEIDFSKTSEAQLLLQKYQIESNTYERQLSRYEKHQKRMKHMRSYILDTVYIGHKPMIREISEVSEIIRKLRKSLLQTNREELYEQHRELIMTKNSLKPKELIQKWRDLIIDMKFAKFTEIPDDRLTRDFIKTTENVLPKFYETWTTRMIEFDLDSGATNLIEIPTVDEIISQFEQWEEVYTKSNPPSRRDIAMATFGDKSDQTEKEKQDTTPKQKTRTCICGQEHLFEDCPYVNSKKRTVNWKPDEAIQKKFEQLERRHGHPRAKMLQRIKKKLEKEGSSGTKVSFLTDAKNDNGNKESANLLYDSDEYIGILLNAKQPSLNPPISTALSASSRNLDIKEMTLLDSGATVHITNKRDKLINMQSNVRTIMAGKTEIQMYGPGQYILHPTDPISDKVICKGIRILEMWYVEGFPTTIISMSQLRSHGIKYDGKTDRLWSERTNEDLCHVKCTGKLYLLEWNSNKNSKTSLSKELALSSFDKRILKDPAQVWHKRFAHVSNKSIENIEKATEGANITAPFQKRNEEGFEEKCEVCAITKIRKKISRVPMTPPTRPFQKLFVDIIVMNLAMNKDSYALHAVDPYTKFHILTTTRTKSVNFNLENMIEEIEHTFKTRIEEIQLDGESSLNGISFRDYSQKRKIRLIVTVPDTPEQNGPSERAGGIISMKSRSLIQEANLPQGLWPEAMKAAVWILNRTPIKALGYKTAYEMAHGTKPYVGNLFLFGSKAYVRVDTKKSEKMALRAQIGFLVGYEAHNIWKIWTTGPNGSKVIRARDVIFDEMKKYDPEHPFAKEIVREGVQRYVDNVDIPNLEDIEQNDIIDSVDEDMNLQSMVSPVVSNIENTGGTLLHDSMDISRPGQALDIQQDVPQNMEIDEPTQPDQDTMDIDHENPENEAQEATQIDNREKSVVKKLKIDSAGGVEHEDNIKEEVDEDKNIPSDKQLPQSSSPVTMERLSANHDAEKANNVNNDLPTPPQGASQHSSEKNESTGTQEPLSTSRAQEINADLSESNIVTGPRIRVPSKRALSPESSSLSRKKHKKLSRAFLARQKLLQDSTTDKILLAALEKLEKPLTEQLPPEPKNWTGVLRHKFKNQFIQAAKTEFEALNKKGTFEFVPRPQNKHILPLTWVFKYKFDKYGKLSKFKARICVRGDLQQPNELEKRAATLAARNFRLMMALAAIFDLEIVQYDAVNAFINSLLDEEVYTLCPDGFKQSGKVIKLRRALYGLRRSPRLWQKELTTTLLSLGFVPIPDEECLFIKNGVLILFFVDDILVFYDKDKKQAIFEETEKGLTSKYELRKMDKFEWFLNIRILRDRAQRKIWLCQDSYIAKIASQFNINTTNNVDTPISGNIEASKGEATNQEIHAYQELVGSALYASIMTRIDVAKAVNELAKHTKNPSIAHFQQIRRVIQYLYNTRFLAIEFSPPQNPEKDAFICASDASFGDNPDRTSSEGYLVQIYGGSVDWRATKQRLVTTSTTEAELRAATEAAKRLQVWKRVFRSIGFKPDRELSIQCDNKQTVALLTSEEPQFRTNLKHVDIYHHWLRQEISKKRLRIEWVDTKRMAADGLTKILRGQPFLDWRKHQGLVNIGHLTQE
ncbi:conserved hypothetical protein [Talaromyces stipitatus ATCC 10500]|uniref:Integrase catalytic domain-containing protein n=1 Tax=Talaromyces stipitatus (strain ATCC 10500 / CBS 375.48 / QM 6759 / NRRL 1006) TaxID=441959 RepID=B8MP65_TALSN|nr:uncharacterized protein TSTA_105160 [Talaromyces stipitatus ATCC 10500]EED14304.1 conserved hypothetical protein [Talaromyces stipitatus ATCC 10500]